MSKRIDSHLIGCWVAALKLFANVDVSVHIGIFEPGSPRSMHGALDECSLAITA